MAKNFPVRYGELEEAILRHLYANPAPRPAHTTYNLAGALRLQHFQGLEASSEQWSAKIQQAKTEIQRAIESLIVERLVKGDRERDDQMIHFTNLKLTPKGEAEAIRLKREHEAAEKQILAADSALARVVEAMNSQNDDPSPHPRIEISVRPSFIPPGVSGECTIVMHQGQDRWWKLYRSDRLACAEATEMGLIDKNNPRGEGGDLAAHFLLKALLPEVDVDPADLRARGFNHQVS